MVTSLDSRLDLRWRLALALAAGLAPAWVAANAPPVKISPDAGSDELAALPLEQLIGLQVVSSASRFAQAIADAPSAVVVLTAQDIRDHGWRTLAEALASLPGLYVNDDRNYAYLGARGFLRPGDYDSRFLLMIDGVRVNDAVYDQATIGTDGFQDMELVQRIEFVPGPGSAVYGSNALFGVINVITKNGSTLGGAQASVSAGSYGERRARVSYGWHGQNGADLLLSGTAYARRGQDLYYAEFDTPEQNHGVARGLDYDRYRSVFAKAAYAGWTLSASHVQRTKGIPTGSFGAEFNTANYTRDTQSFARAGYERALAPGLSASALAYWGRSDYLGEGRYPDPEGVARLNVDGDHAAWYGASAYLTYIAPAGHKLVAGFDLQRNRRRDQFNYDPAPYLPLLDDRRSDTRGGVFVQDESHLAPGWILNAGARYDWDSATGHSFNPRLALIWHAGPRDTAKLVYGTAYRSPNAYELYYAYSGEPGQVANPGLKPEHISTRELILEHRYGDPGQARLSLFHYDMHGLIGQETLPDSGMLQFLNVDRAAVSGAELALERNVGRGARLRASHTWLRSRDGQGVELSNSPRRLAKLNLAVPVFGHAARAAGELQCLSSRLTGTARIGGYCVANLTVSSVRLMRRADMSLSVYNAFNARYADPGGGAFEQQAIARQSRTLAAKLVVGF
ncbi:TonB-dependent receptor plug domain-containing protein [Pseudoduganella namucuonensis]|uniref:Iron complex outermembrane recepter protein n=1 Tax=Pseudoduganella namucuonensis TaxID=1035707 RepID=A0A1I7GQ79_9BURK|nr:TonB-dependent receptor [Pseudoduganella namucuonensis]SFU50598.1 iron complex outermembrane recepter protein [Pseudoduganella namucuonensis]